MTTNKTECSYWTRHAMADADMDLLNQCGDYKAEVYDRHYEALELADAEDPPCGECDACEEAEGEADDFDPETDCHHCGAGADRQLKEGRMTRFDDHEYCTAGTHDWSDGADGETTCVRCGEGVSDEMIKELRAEAAEAGDDEQIVICDIALGMGPEGNDGTAWEERYGGGGLDVPPSEQRRLLTLTQVEAVELCARVIADAAAMV